jgi:hypothetical protein
MIEHFNFPTRDEIQYHLAQTSFDFVDRGSDQLLVTIGDSWTWGADLTTTQDQQYRLDNVYGNVIADHLGFDFLNLAVGGSNNTWMAEQFERLAELYLPYKKIVCIITFTEAAREFNSKWDSTFDYLYWTQQNIIMPNDYYRWLALPNECAAQRIKQALLTTNIKLIVGTNFVDSIGVASLNDYLLPTSWIDQYSPEIFKPIDHTCYVTSHWVFDKLNGILDINPDLDKSMFKYWITELADSALQRLEFISNPKYFKRIHHPISSGHQCWANYILKHL